MLGEEDPVVTVKAALLLATPPTVTITLPLVAPVGTGAAMLVALQLVGVAAIPLNVTLLVSRDPPKLAPVIVTDIPTGPDAGLRPVMLGPVEPDPAAALTATSTAPQLSELARDAPAEATPVVARIRSSTMSCVFGSAGTRSLMEYPEPTVKDAMFGVANAARSKSPLEVVVRAPLFSEVPVPVPVMAASKELAAATPEYSRTTNRRGAEIVSDTV